MNCDHDSTFERSTKCNPDRDATTIACPNCKSTTRVLRSEMQTDCPDCYEVFAVDWSGDYNCRVHQQAEPCTECDMPISVEKRKRLEAAGWQFGTVEDFLGSDGSKVPSEEDKCPYCENRKADPPPPGPPDLPGQWFCLVHRHLEAQWKREHPAKPYVPTVAITPASDTENETYVRLVITPRGQDTRSYRMSRHAAAVLRDELSGLLATPKRLSDVNAWLEKQKKVAER